MDSNRTGAFAGAFAFILGLYWFWVVVLVPHTASEPPWVFLDYANLIFHEAGHVLFMFFGDFLHVLGGSLTQLLIPGIVLWNFVRQGDSIAAGFTLFWLGQSASNVSYYIADARAQALPLLGGDPSGHDWTWLLSHMNVLSSDTFIGEVVRFVAVALMVIGLLWMGFAVYQKWTTAG
jgi:hypothetical protein